MKTVALEVQNLVKHFPTGSQGVVHAVNDVSFTIRAGETLGLVGESGSGKTTVGRCVVGLAEPTAGHIAFGDSQTRIGTRQPRSTANVQIVFQDAQTSLNPRMTVSAVVAEPLQLQGSSRRRGEWSRAVSETLRLVGLDDGVLDRYPRHLTAGEQQRVALARAVVAGPTLVVLDEVTSALDPFSRREILGLIQRLESELQTAFMLISHDLAAVEQVSQRIAVMYLGKIVEIGPTEQVMSRPQHPYTVALLSAMLSTAFDHKRPKPMLNGEIPSPLQLPTGCYLASRCPMALPECTTDFPPLELVGTSHRAACIRVNEAGFRERLLGGNQ